MTAKCGTELEQSSFIASAEEVDERSKSNFALVESAAEMREGHGLSCQTLRTGLGLRCKGGCSVPWSHMLGGRLSTREAEIGAQHLEALRKASAKEISSEIGQTTSAKMLQKHPPVSG